MKTFDLVIALFSIGLIILGLIYKKLNRSIVSETLLATLYGIMLSPLALHVLEAGKWAQQERIMENACRLTLSMALMATAFRIPKEYLKQNKKTTAILLFLVMPAMWLCCAFLLHLFTKLTWPLSLLAGAMITPTDPVLAGAIVSGDKAKAWLPQRVRSTISFEAGANDGLAYPFVLLSMMLVQQQEATWTTWLLQVVLWQTAGAIALGLAIGYIAGKLLHYAVSKNHTGKPAILAFSISMAFFVLTGMELIGINGVLGVFMCGIMLKRELSKQENIEEEDIQDMMARLFTIPVFVLFGLILPWQQWLQLGWPALLLVVSILLLRRLPFIFLARPLLHNFKVSELAFMGWFGPIGAAALFYCFFCMQRIHNEMLWAVCSLAVFSSVLVHGISAWPFLKWYHKQEIH